MTAKRSTGGSGQASRDAPAEQRIEEILGRLNDACAARIELNYESPLELAVATILSAQCTDARVNQVTEELFERYRSAEDYADAEPEEFQEEIRSTGFFRNKTRSILGFARGLVEDHGGRVPDTMEALVELPGIGRKTANVILGGGFGKAEGIVVDTHVKRVARRLGLTEESDPVKIERDLMELVPKDEWIDFGLRMIQHGRYTCTARTPACETCPLEELCPSAHAFD